MEMLNTTKKLTDEQLQNLSKFNMAGQVCFAAGEDKKNVRLILYDGSIVDHWWFGKLAFDLGTMKLEKKRIPILIDHDTDRRAGYSTGASFDGKFVLEGRLLSNSKDAQAIVGDIKEGFPFEASLRFDPAKSKIEHIRKDEETTVNGRRLAGHAG